MFIIIILLIGLLSYYFIRHPVVTIFFIFKILGLFVLGLITIAIFVFLIALIGNSL